ncbi:hypothetical protein ALO41_200100 [Pseudomonas amygdali pv. ulmi]|uniref:Uncharacterized protein n=1 Tax=Pseudomonas amygdali pv. ulmi TaxID=251720 RepID=A0A0Q0DGW0_PSEA0|nr:hypothetical protein ALO41_200100 [Pseudomonas amygdali pv. ulmi]
MMNTDAIYYLFAFLALGAAYAGIFLWVPAGRSSTIRYCLPDSAWYDSRPVPETLCGQSPGFGQPA